MTSDLLNQQLRTAFWSARQEIRSCGQHFEMCGGKLETDDELSAHKWVAWMTGTRKHQLTQRNSGISNILITFVTVK
jgi:hypothetical protein